MSMLFKRIKDWATSITAFRTGDVIPVDGSVGTAKMSKDNLLRVTAENALAGNVAPAFDPTKPNGSDGYAYHNGDPIVYLGHLYRFTADKTTGAWDDSKVKAVDLDEFILQAEALTNLENNSSNPFRAKIATIALAQTEVKAGFIHRVNGVFTEGTFDPAAYCAVFEISGGEFLNFSTTLHYNIYCGQYAFYDINMNPLTADPIDVVAGASVQYANIKAPLCAKYLFVACNSSTAVVTCTKNLYGEYKASDISEGNIHLGLKEFKLGFINRTNGSWNSQSTTYGCNVFEVVGGVEVTIKSNIPANIYCGRYAFYDENMNALTADPIDGSNVQTDISYSGVVAPAGAKYLYVSATNASVVSDVFVAGEGGGEDRVVKQSYSMSNTALGTESVNVGEESFVKNNYEISVHITFDSFQGFKFRKGVGTDYRTGEFEITATQLIVKQAGSVTDTFNHGLTISKYLQIKVFVDTYRKTKIVMKTDSDGEYTANVSDFYAHGTLRLVGNSYGYTVENAYIVYNDLIAGAGIRVYGDSYFQVDANRWPYYAYQSGAKFLLNSKPGSGAAALYAQVLKDIAVAGYPSILVWGSAQNDGSDSDENTPSSTWLSYVENLISLCDGKCELVFCTTPSTSVGTHNAKDKWIRSSGFRYIDLSKAVASTDLDTTWKYGMLGTGSNANHPTNYGASTMAEEAISSLPELVSY